MFRNRKFAQNMPQSRHELTSMSDSFPEKPYTRTENRKPGALPERATQNARRIHGWANSGLEVKSLVVVGFVGSEEVEIRRDRGSMAVM